MGFEKRKKARTKTAEAANSNGRTGSDKHEFKVEQLGGSRPRTRKFLIRSRFASLVDVLGSCEPWVMVTPRDYIFSKLEAIFYQIIQEFDTFSWFKLLKTQLSLTVETKCSFSSSQRVCAEIISKNLNENSVKAWKCHETCYQKCFFRLETYLTQW